MIKVNITESQYKKNILSEEENPYYAPSKSNGKNLDMLWQKIFQKQKELNDEIFNDLDALTKKKAKLFQNTLGVKLDNSGRDSNLQEIPHVMINAGNAKLPQNVLVVNITSALACPSFYLGTCCIKGSLCYAQQSENYQWHNVAAKNFKTDLMNTELLRKYQNGNKEPMRKYFSLVEMYINIGNAAATNLYKSYINQIKKSGKVPTESQLEGIRVLADSCKITDIRLNEAGDFPCQLSVDLWSKFAKKVKRKYNINVHAYTARYLDFSKTPDSFSVMPSHNNINIGNEKFRSFVAVSKDKYDSLVGGDSLDENGQPILGTTPTGVKFYKCPCTAGKSECGLCGVCRRKNLTDIPYTIFVELHAQKNATGLSMLYKTDEMAGIVKDYNKLGWSTPMEKEMSANRKNLEGTKELDKNIDRLRNK